MPSDAKRQSTRLRPSRLREVGQHGTNRGDAVFHGLVFTLAAGAIGLLLLLLGILFSDARDAVLRYGLSFLTTTKWDPVALRFGAGAYIYGTLITSAIALIIATPIALGAALFVGEYAPGWLAEPVSFVTELLAVIPSIIYGLWGFFILAPLMRFYVEPFLRDTVGRLPVVGSLFSGPALGRDLLIGGVILAIMILPTVMSISREVIRAVPNAQREGMLALGATRWEAIRHAVLPYARVGIAGAAILGLARALGETMAVTMVIGNSSTRITGSLFTPGYTMASAIANQFTEADSPIYFSAIVEVALVLLLVAALVNILARLLIWSFLRGPGKAIRA
ncbi:MAG: phosphate ABC transporter permease subunit PstC [Chloroflexota bacterium]|nr:MAG: phosphate ABC transporter permease subunit PstC [Chloroflexota bacterium]